MLKLIPARGDRHIFKNGDVIAIKRGSAAIGEIHIASAPKGNRTTLYNADGDVISSSENTYTLTSENIRSQYWHFTYGTALYLKVKEEKVEEPILAQGQRWKAKIHTAAAGVVTAEFIVNSPVNVLPGQAPLWNVHVKRIELQYSAHEHISKLSDINGLDVKSIQQLCPNGVVATPEREDKKRKHILWCPTSNLPPRVVMNSLEKAMSVAKEMTERHGTEFFVCELVAKASTKTEVVRKSTVTVEKV